MKKLFSILLLIVMLCVPFNSLAGTPSPTIKSLYKFNPAIKFEFLDQRLINLDLNYWEPFMILQEFDENNDWHRYHLDEGFILFLDKPYEIVEVTFPIPYSELTTIYGVFITEEERTFVTYGIVTEKGSVLFDFSYLPVEDIIMFVVSNQIFRGV